MLTECERCGAWALPRSRYCKECKKEVLRELAECGYLTWRPAVGRYRGTDARENVRETKHGTGHG